MRPPQKEQCYSEVRWIKAGWIRTQSETGMINSPFEGGSTLSTTKCMTSRFGIQTEIVSVTELWGAQNAENEIFQMYE